VSIQRHVPGTAGAIDAGGAVTGPTSATGTIDSENRIRTSASVAISPRGEISGRASGPTGAGAGAASGEIGASATGLPVGIGSAIGCTTLPGRGGGADGGRIAGAGMTTSGSGGSRASSCCVSASGSGAATGPSAAGAASGSSAVSAPAASCESGICARPPGTCAAGAAGAGAAGAAGFAGAVDAGGRQPLTVSEAAR
jgi:hypothetical protein